MGHHHDHNHAAGGNIATAFFLNLAFTVVEIIGGVLTNSVAVLSDALHDLGDSIALGLAWKMDVVSQRGRDARHSYGYRRYNILGAVINSVVLIVGSVFIVREAILRLANPEPSNALGMIALAILGVAVNGYAASRLTHGHSHNVDVARLHLLEDVLGWVAILIGATIMYFWNLPFIDPVLSIAISLFILYQVIKRLRTSLRIMLQGVPGDMSVDNIREKLRAMPDVQDVHDTHLWTMDGQYHVLTTHVVLHKSMQMHELSSLKQKVRSTLQKKGIDHATIEFEYAGEECVLVDC